MKKLLILLTILVLSGCAFTEYAKSMKSGKEHLRNGQYEEALADFSNALIEKPTDKDALALKERTENSIKMRDYHEKINQFLKDTGKIYEQLLEIAADYDTSLSTITIEQANSDIEKLSKIEDYMSSLSEKWSYDDTFKNAYYSLVNSINDLEYAAQAISENVVDLNLSEKSRFEVLRSDDSKVRAKISINDFKVTLKDYEQKVNDLKKEQSNTP